MSKKEEKTLVSLESIDQGMDFVSYRTNQGIC